MSSDVKRIVWRKYTLGRVWNGVEPVVRVISVGWRHFRPGVAYERRKRWLEVNG